jgi:hypothetical protein
MAKLLKPLDAVVIVFALCIAVYVGVVVYGGASIWAQISIKSAGRTWVFPLDAEETIIVSGPLGNTTIEIRDGEAYILHSPCANQTCIAVGPIHRQGQWVACLPNGVFLSIEGEENGGLDATTW